MNRALKGTGVALGVAVALVAATIAVGAAKADAKRLRVVALPPLPAFVLHEAPGALERGKYLFETRGCAECHGADGGGHAFMDTPAMRVKSPNIAGGSNSAVAHYTAADYDRTIRHGVKPDGRAVFIMPSEDYNRLTDDDLGALVAYIRHLPPTPGGPLEERLPLPLRVLYGLGAIPDAAEKIDHALPPSTPVAEGTTVDHGRYVATMCMGCHGPGLSGGKIPGGPPDWPAAANLTPGNGSAMPRYADAAAFTTMLRTGVRPDGAPISRVMPFGSLKALSDTDAAAVYLFLKSVPAKAAGNR
jgi:mono/diheme cytochrome c family protein